MMPFGMPYCSLGYLPKWIAAFMTVACLSCASAQEARIEAELSQTLAGDRLKIGSSFALQVLAPWEQAECRLASGALLHATVQAVTRTKGHTQGITFMVDAPCGERKPRNRSYRNTQVSKARPGPPTQYSFAPFSS
jgi:hypothetical protein